MEEIEADIKERAHSGWGFDRIYLQEADPFIRKTEDLLKIADVNLKKATVLYTAELVLVPVQGGKIGLKQGAATGIDVWDLEA